MEQHLLAHHCFRQLSVGIVSNGSYLNSKKMPGNLLNEQDATINLTINTDKREILDGENVDGVVYKPTVTDDDTKLQLDYQTMKPDNGNEATDTFFLYRTAFIGE